MPRNRIAPAHAQTKTRGKQRRRDFLVHASLQRGQKHDRELQAFGRVDGEDAHHVARFFGLAILLPRIGIAKPFQFVDQIVERLSRSGFSH